MKKLIIIIVFLFSLSLIFSIFLIRIGNKRNNIDSFTHSVFKIEKIVPQSEEIYFLATINERSKATEIYFQSQFALAPRIVIKKFKNIPNKSFILLFQENLKDTIDLNIDKLFCDSVCLFKNDKYYFTLLKKK